MLDTLWCILCLACENLSSIVDLEDVNCGALRGVSSGWWLCETGRVDDGGDGSKRSTLLIMKRRLMIALKVAMAMSSSRCGGVWDGGDINEEDDRTIVRGGIASRRLTRKRVQLRNWKTKVLYPPEKGKKMHRLQIRARF